MNSSHNLLPRVKIVVAKTDRIIGICSQLLYQKQRQTQSCFMVIRPNQLGAPHHTLGSFSTFLQESLQIDASSKFVIKRRKVRRSEERRVGKEGRSRLELDR